MAEDNTLFEITESFGNNLPAVSFDMLVDFLSDCTILVRPNASQRRFRWFSSVSKDQAPASVLPENQILYIGRMEAARQLLEAQRYAFVLILATDDEIPDWVRDYRHRVILVRQSDTFTYFMFLVQQFFVQLLVWENELDRVIYQNGSLDDLLNVGSSLIKNFVSITDSKLNLIAYTHRVKPPDATHKHLVDVGCLPDSIASEHRRLTIKKTLSVIDESEGAPYKRLHFPIYVNHGYFASVVMVCKEQPPTKGLQDLFRIFLKRVTVVCETIWKNHIRMDAPHYFFFTKLLNCEHASRSYIESQIRLTDIPTSPQLKLLVIEPNETDWLDRLEAIAEAASRVNHGDCYSFPYKNDLLVLCYAVDGDSQLSHRKSADELNHLIYRPFGISSGVSNIFDCITDIDMAYKQAKISLGLKNTIQSELFATGEKRDKGVYLFGEALVYYLLSQTEKDERFMKFTFSRTVLQKIYAEDQEYGTNNVALFWFYLHHERNATIVAQRLHLHRNTVLYHIDKIQKRFDFDLSVQSARENMLMDFKIFFLMSNHDSMEKIFSDSQDISNEQKLPPSTSNAL